MGLLEDDRVGLPCGHIDEELLQSWPVDVAAGEAACSGHECL